MGAEFSGCISHTLDAKGRATIPAAYREALGDEFTIGLNSEFNAVALYPKRKWDRIGEGLDRIPDTDVRGMRYVRLINGNSFAGCSLDQQGRVLIPAALRQKAGLDKSIRFIGVGQYIEIWDDARYQENNAEAENDPHLTDYVNETYYLSHNP